MQVYSSRLDSLCSSVTSIALDLAQISPRSSAARSVGAPLHPLNHSESLNAVQTTYSTIDYMAYLFVDESKESSKTGQERR